jgi:hypothetical protein
MTTVEAVEVSFNSFESHDQSANKMLSRFPTSSSEFDCADSCLLHVLDDASESFCFFKNSFSVGGDGFGFFPEVT